MSGFAMLVAADDAKLKAFVDPNNNEERLPEELFLESDESDLWDAHERGLDIPENQRDPDHPRPDVAIAPEGYHDPAPEAAPQNDEAEADSDSRRRFIEESLLRLKFGGNMNSTSSNGRRRATDSAGDEQIQPSQEEEFTMVFLADVEGRYRGHGPEQVKRVVKFVRDLGDYDLKFDSGAPITKPDLVVHGGDLNADCWRDCSWWPHVLGTTPEDDFNDWWDLLYDAGIPMISNFGNHDWEFHTDPRTYTADARPKWVRVDGHLCRAWEGGVNKTDTEFFKNFPHKKLDESNRKSIEFVHKTFEKSVRTSADFSYTRYNKGAASGAIAPDMYKAEFKGFQIAMFMRSAFNPYHDANDNQILIEDTATFDALSAGLDREKHTMFVSHFPMRDQTCKEGIALAKLIREFPDVNSGASAHFAGHVHLQSKFRWNNVMDYTAPYPYAVMHNGKKIPGSIYVARVHPNRGIQEVKVVEIQKDCWEYGQTCLAGTTCEWNCCDDKNNYEHWYSKGITACGKEPRWDRGTYCFAGTSCDRCKEGQEATWWYGKHPNGYHCGKEDKWGDGTYCLKGTSCNNCRNTATWWYGTHPNGYYCGKEKCWGKDTRCYGTSCDTCCNSAHMPWYWFGGGQCK